MTDTTAPPPADGRRAGAAWVAGTGAFLLLAAAAVFIAVQWRTLPEAAKLALVGASTGGFLAGGRALRRTLPATGDVLFHLGAFLVPVDVAGLCLRLDADWRAVLLAEGAVGTAFLGGLAAVTGSVVLGWAGGLSAVVLALGVAGVTPLPAPLVLAVAAGVAHLLGRRRTSVAWAAMAGLAPVLGAGAAGVLAALAGRSLGAGVLADLGLSGSAAAAYAVLSGALAAGVLGREAHRSHDLGLVALAGISLVSGAGVAWVATDPSAEANAVAAPAVFVLLQLVAVLAARDPFWKRPLGRVALTAELMAAMAAPVAAVFVLAAPIVDEGFDFLGDAPPWSPEPSAAMAFGLLAAGWLLGGWRRQTTAASPGAALRAAIADDRTVAFLATAAAAAVVVGSASTAVSAGAFLLLAAVLVTCRGTLAGVGTIPLVAWAPLTLAITHPAAVLPTAVVGALVLAAAARSWGQRGGGVPAVGYATAAALVLTTATVHAGDGAGVGLATGLLIGVFAAWAVALVVEPASWGAGVVARTPMALFGLAALDVPLSEAIPVALAATLLFAVDALRTDDARLGLGAAVTLPVAVVVTSMTAGLTVPEAGVTLAVAAVVLAGLGALTPERFRMPMLAAAGTTIGTGLALAAGHPTRLAEAVILAGGLAVAAGLVLGRGVVMHAGGAVATVGIVLHLRADGVTAVEPFVLPVSAQLAVAGWQLRRRLEDAVSSWVAFGPAIALLGGAALVERVGGGDGWHALIAGAVGVAAVAFGGWKRLAGPLFLGTGLVVSVTLLETLHALAGVPTWAWLAAGGSALLATGVGLERAATSPTEAGRRLVEVVSERFD